MPRKLYIPTCTSNFNNLLSSESISPESFYLNRKFGYKRFVKIEPNNFSDFILAYDKIPKYTLSSKNYENYPLIIEIEDDLIDLNGFEEVQIAGIGIFKINQTIYLHPDKVRFLFFSNDHLKLSLIKSEPSIETKLIPFYRSKFEVLDGNENKNLFQWNSSYIKAIKNIPNSGWEKHVLEDEKIDKLKGFYYSYYLGKLSSPNTKIEKSKENLYEINRLFDNLKSGNSTKIKELIDLSQQFLSELQQYKNFIESEQLDFQIDFNFPKITNIEDLIFKNKGNHLFKDLINEIIDFPIYNLNDFKEQKAELAYKLGTVLKEYILSIKEWEGSKEQIYFNSLLDNIVAYQRFDVQSHDNLVLQSIALYIQKGDDPEKLIDSLNLNGVKNIEIALGLWGATFGFSALPKTISYKLFERDNKRLTNIFYKDIQKKLNNTYIESDITIFSPALPDIEEQSRSLPNTPTEMAITADPTPGEKTLIDNKKTFCPKCGSELQIKTNTKNNKKFLGCSKFPNCKYAEAIDNNKKKNTINDILEFIKDRVNDQREYKLSDINSELKNKFQTSYTIGQLENIIKDKLATEFDLIKIGKSSGIKKRINAPEFDFTDKKNDTY